MLARDPQRGLDDFAQPLRREQSLRIELVLIEDESEHGVADLGYQRTLRVARDAEETFRFRQHKMPCARQDATKDQLGPVEHTLFFDQVRVSAGLQLLQTPRRVGAHRLGGDLHQFLHLAVAGQPLRMRGNRFDRRRKEPHRQIAKLFFGKVDSAERVEKSGDDPAVTGICVQSAGDVEEVINADLDKRAGEPLNHWRIRVRAAPPLADGNEGVEFVGGKRRAVAGRAESAAVREVVETSFPEGLSPALETALVALSAGEREVVALRVLLDLDGESAARVLGISATACSTRLSRALAKLEEKVRNDALV